MIKKMSNWLVGSFFRTIGRFLAIAGLGILFYIIASKSGLKLSDLLGITRVYADTGTFSSSTWSIKTINPNLSDCTDTGNGIVCAPRSWENQVALGNYYYDNSYLDNSVLVTDFRMFAYASSTDKFIKDRLYTFNYNICQSKKLTSSVSSNIKIVQWGYNSNNAATGQTYGNNNAVSLVIDEIDGTTTINNVSTYCYNYKFSVILPIDSRYVGFYMRYADYNNEFAYLNSVNKAGTLYSVKSLSVSYTTGSNAVIQDSANQIINNQNNNTNTIINNQNQNTQNIIDNQNQNTQDMIDSQKVCYTKLIDSNYENLTKGYLSSQGELVTDNGHRVTDYIQIDNTTKIEVLVTGNNTDRICFYNSVKTKISCIDRAVQGSVSVPNNSKYVRVTINYSANIPQVEIKTCKNGNQGVSDSVNDLNDSLNDSDTSQASSQATDLFNNFTNDSHGLTAVIQAPLNFIQTLSSKTCSVIRLPIPFVSNSYIELPCLSAYYQEHFSTLLILYQTIISGLIGYKIAVSIFYMVKGFKDPESDKIEVLDL